MKSWKILRKNLRWCLIMLLCFLVQGLIPPNVIANHDLKFLVTLSVTQKVNHGFEKSIACVVDTIQHAVLKTKEKQITTSGSQIESSIIRH